VNNFYLLFLTTLLIFGKISYVEAYEPIDQSFCLPGYHPEGPSFAYDCVSNSTGEIEGQESGSGSSSSSSYPLPPPSNTARVKGHAENVWGALVLDSKMLIANYKESKNIGIAMGQKTKQEAIDFAMSECENDGGKQCQVQVTISGSCLALAGAEGQILWATQKHTEGDNAFDTSAAAERKALAKCNEKGYQRCEVFYSDCSIIKWVWD